MNFGKKLYHTDVYMPEELKKGAKQLISSNLRFSRHLKEHLSSPDTKHDLNGHGINDSIKKIKNGKATLFEVETFGDKVVKAVYRLAYNETQDISIVLRNHLVVTAWLNDKTDTHTTLDVDKYERS